MSHLAKFTAETPTASTVPEPWGEPGGPGLWKHKGKMLPAYIQHISHALALRGMDESRAIATAVATVKRWAAGKASGKGHVHPDVQAAAAKAVTEWEKAKAESHAATAAKEGSRAVKATQGLSKILSLADSGVDQDTSSSQLASSVDACLDEACDALKGVDLTKLPPEVQQAIALLYAASDTVDELLESLNIPDPDDNDDTAMSNTDPRTPGLTSKLGRILALASDSADGCDLEGGSMTAAGSVMDEDDGKVGIVTKLRQNGMYVGKHKSGKATKFKRTRKEAAQGVLELHKKGQSNG